ncbi:hypothetical protein GCM10022261_06530 [Brevibacterium daeguense]|uniref:non-specific serine/threonine protein kinase n=1 Tax=Brevibacterium daeguense TaxID=909936 RepID=A0ABP8EGP0_9MICO|nr:serine/threonine-protein kinase [Brevibacterium daeguense]
MEELGGYRLIEQLGSGGMGVVHLGVDGDNNPVAVKVLHPHIANDETARKRLGREVRTLRRIKHPRIAEVLDAELESERPFIVTEFVDGATLSDDVRENGPFAEDELVHFGHALLDALNAVHEAGVIHRDLKPANIMIMDGEPIIIDFGIAQAADEVKVTATGLVMGTPGYLSPEIADGKASSEKTDWWGWAASMAFAATGRNPYGSGPLEAVLGRVALGRADLEGVPALFVPLLRACLDPRPERRPSGPMILDSLVDIESGRMPSLGGPVRQGPMTGHATGASGPVGAAGPGGTSVMPAAVPGPGFGSGGPAPGPAAAHLASPYRDHGPAAHGVPRQAHPSHQQPLPVMQHPGPQHPGPQRSVAQYGPAVGSGPRPYGPLGIDQRAQNQQLQQHLQHGPVQHSPMPQQQPHLVPPGPPRRRRGGGWAVLALNVLAIALTPLGPFIVLIAAYLWQILARTAGSVAKTRNWRQFEQGPASTGVWSSVSAMPFAALGAVFTSLFSLILPLIAAVAIAILMRLDVMGIVPGGHSEQWALWAAGLTCAVVLWLGPGSTNLRHGSKVLFSGVTRSATGEWVTVAILGALTVLAILTVLSGAAVSWWPVQLNPFALMPEPLL